VDTTLNIKGKHLQLYREIRKGLGEERCALCALKAEPRYESDDSEALEMKQSIEQYKCTAEDALHGLKNMCVEEAAVSSPVQPPASKNSNNGGTPEKHPDVDVDSFDSESNKLVT
jgi:hypothetical protein